MAFSLSQSAASPLQDCFYKLNYFDFSHHLFTRGVKVHAQQADAITGGAPEGCSRSLQAEGVGGSE